MKPMKAVLSISIGCPERSYRAMTKWKKFDFLRLLGGCFSKWALPTVDLENIETLDTQQNRKYVLIIGFAIFPFKLFPRSIRSKFINIEICTVEFDVLSNFTDSFNQY